MLAEVRGNVATLTLNRPARLNALSHGMIAALGDHLERWAIDARVHTVVLRGAGEKAFCAGGDLRELHENAAVGAARLEEYFAAEYALDYRIHAYPKPVVALIDGIVMGGGMGISQGAALRVVGARTRMAMPETAIGLFPDVGGSWFLSRVPGEIGTYLGLAGPTIEAADAIYCGLADVHAGPGESAPSQLEVLRPAIDRHFAHQSVAAIMGSLVAEDRPECRAWAGSTLEALRKRSPTMLVVTLEMLRRGARLSLAECLRMELGLVLSCFEQGDIVEGVRALIVDKDNAPRWNPPRLADVPADTLERFFVPRWEPAQHPLARLPG